MKTYSAKKENFEKKWILFDAQDQVVGHLASKIAMILQGKHTPKYTKHIDTGDFVVVVNADKIHFTGNKLENKKYYSYSGYVGGLKTKTALEMMNTKPEEVLKKAVKGMLPKNALGRNMFKKLKVYKGSEHPHSAQKPEEYKRS